MDPKKGAGNEMGVPKSDEIPLRSSSGEFDPAEMLECASCHRKTPPNRLDCMYCGTRLILNAEQKALLKPVIRPPADDASGFNLISFATGKSISDEQIGSISGMTRMAERDLRLLAESGSTVPLARGDSKEPVELAAERMREYGLDVEIFSDSEVEIDLVPKRVRGISLEGDGRIALILFNNDEVVGLSREEIEMVVVGIAFQNRIEANEKHKKKGLQKVLNTTEFSDDEVLIDIYASGRRKAFRIQPTGFDFSFLGAKKALVAPVNLKLTLRFLCDFAPDAVFDESYPSIHSAIEGVWRMDVKQETKSINRKGFGSFEKTRVTTSSNLEQFTKYSALQRLGLLRSRIDKL